MQYEILLPLTMEFILVVKDDIVSVILLYTCSGLSTNALHVHMKQHRRTKMKSALYRKNAS